MVLGFITNVGLKFGDGWIKEYYQKREHSRKLKIECGEYIRTFCIEGMTNGFQKLPGSQHHIQDRV